MTQNLLKLKNIHKGKRCFIIGTGPSLNRTNISLLKDEIIFGVNSLYDGFKKFNVDVTYFCISDLHAFLKHWGDVVNKLKIPLFVSCGAATIAKRNIEGITIIEPQLPYMNDVVHFSKDLTKGANWGGSVTIDVCLQLAYYMGFSKVYLLGCDCDYSKGKRYNNEPGSNAVSSPDFRHNDFSGIYEAYKICKKVFEEDGREIINCTPGGRLEVFKRKKLEEVITNGDNRRKI